MGVIGFILGQARLVHWNQVVASLAKLMQKGFVWIAAHIDPG